jgi:hypothetical protein
VIGAEEFGFFLGGIQEGSMHPDSLSAGMGWRHALGENEIYFDSWLLHSNCDFSAEII